jgi:hypothetical protein
MLAPVKLLKLGLIAPHRQQWDNRRDQVYVTKLALQVTPVDPICAIMTKHKIHPTTTHFLRAKGSLREAQRERGNIIWSAAFHMLEFVRATSLFQSCARELLHFCKACVYPISRVYILAGLHTKITLEQLKHQQHVQQGKEHRQLQNAEITPWIISKCFVFAPTQKFKFLKFNFDHSQVLAFSALVAAASAGVVAPVGYAAPAAYGYAAPAAYGYAAPIARAAYAAPLARAYAAPAVVAHAAPAYGYAAAPALVKAVAPAPYDANPQYR